MIAAIEPAEDLGRRCGLEAMRIGRPVAEPLSLLGDGAERIWNFAGRRFAGVEQVLDSFHAAGHLAELTRAGFGEDAAAAMPWLDRARLARLARLADGWAGACEFVAKEAPLVPEPASLQAAYPAMANDLAGHRDRLNPAARLARGQTIGSRLIEGTIKQYVGRRMKLTGSRWLTGHVGPFGELCAIADSPEWETHRVAA